MQKFIFDVIENNKEYFTKEEYELIINNVQLAKKLNFLDYTNAREIYK